jgi:glycosyltransferase involved in cell wall biosynthesis
MTPRTARLAYFVSHPIQYQAPLLRRIAQEPDIDLHVFFSSDHSAGEFVDEGFGVKVTWDVPLLSGYKSEFLPRLPGRDGLGFSRPLCYGIFDRIQQGGFDAVWVHGYSTVNALQAIFSGAMLDAPVLLRAESTLHDRERSPMKLAAKEVFFSTLRRHVRGVLAIGQANANYWRRYMGDGVPVYPMPYAVDNAFFERKAVEAASAVDALRRDLKLDADCPVILFASKLQPRKRCGDLLDAWLRLRDAGVRAYLLIVGDGEEKAALEGRALASGYREDVRFTGFKNQTELPVYFALCNVFVLPSVHEPWGLVVNEAMAAARPVVVSDDVGCQPDLVHDGVNGRVFPAGDVAALAAALADVLADKERARAMGEAGLGIIRRHGFEEDIAGLRCALSHVVPGFAAGSLK